MTGMIRALLLIAALSQTAVAETGENAPQDGLWQLEYCANPRMPYGAIRKRAGGVADVLFDISEDGKAENIRVQSVSAGTPEPNDAVAIQFGRAAARALTRWRYFAYIENGQLSGRKDVSLTFRFGEPSDADKVKSDCLFAALPALPSTAGNPGDPFNALKFCTTPRLPKRLDKKKYGATASLTYKINPEGQVYDVAALSGGKEEIDLAKSYVGRWRYAPFIIEGKPVSREIERLDFYLGNPPMPEGVHSCTHAPSGSSRPMKIERR